MTSLGDWGIVDLTLDSDDEEEESLSFPALPKSPRTTVPLPGSSRPSVASTPQAPRVPVPVATPRNPPTAPSASRQHNANGFATTTSSSSSMSNAMSATTGAPRHAPAPLHVHAYDGAYEANGMDRPPKKRKTSTPGGQMHTQSAPTAHRQINAVPATRPTDNLAVHAQPKPTPSRLADKGMSSNMMNKAPSVQYMNAALKSTGTTTTLLDKMETSGPRPLQFGRVSYSSSFDVPRSMSSPENEDTRPNSILLSHHKSQEPQSLQKGKFSDERGPHTQITSRHQTRSERPSHVATNPAPTPRNQLLRSGYFSGAMIVEHDRDSVMSDASVTGHPAESPTTAKAPTTVQKLMSVPPSNKAASQQPRRTKNASQFSVEEDHLLIFLKEVKKFSWKVITAEFQKHYPERLYHTLQSRYTLKTNRRDRSHDPAVLSLPPQWAGEATIDWSSVHADNPGPRDRLQTVDLQHATSRPAAAREIVEPDYSSGTDSGTRQARPRRAPPINYDVRMRMRQQRFADDQFEIDEVFAGDSAEADSPMRSETPQELDVVPKTHTVINTPLDMEFDTDNATVALFANNTRLRNTKPQKLPYLDSSQRTLLQEKPEDWEWEQLASRDWRGMLLHVDFSPAEMAHVERAVAKVATSPQRRKHSTQRRQLRTMLKGLSDSKLQRLVHTLKRRLPARKSHAIKAFLNDAGRGRVAEAPQILRLAAARPPTSRHTVHTETTSSMLRGRELGIRSRRGWQAASKPLTYQVKNKLMDTLGPLATWTGASGDIHTVAWSRDGKHFAAGAVAVTDSDSMQYNRPNNLLFGSLLDTTIHELAEHTIERERTSSGANSSHAMFVSQDPKLYTTVTSVAFAESGKLMYSAGYDEHVYVWDLDPGFSQPSLVSGFKHKAEVEMLVVNRKHAGVLATAAKRTDGGAAIKLVTLEEDNPVDISRHDFQSAKAVSRADLRILPQALQFEPRGGNYLLAGFGANVREDNAFDTTGDLCLWDITSQVQIPIHGSGKNVFDVTFNPNRRYMPLFAAGGVAGSNVNRGTRSVIRLYEERTPDKFTCPLEIECKALDMNDLVWSPQDEHLIAAGCTDGRVYVWDLRNSEDPLKVLCHGRSLMPLQDDLPHERTDTGVRFLSWGENSTRLYSGSSDGVVKVWDVTRSDDDTFVKDIVTFNSGIMAGAFSPDYSKLILGEVNGSVNILEVGRDDCELEDMEKLRYIPYTGVDYHAVTGAIIDKPSEVESGVVEGNHLLSSQQLQLAPMGNLPITQVVQGPNYSGPFDKGVDAPYLRAQALEFQLSMVANPGPQCDISTCADNVVKMTSEEAGDSGRSADRIPDELRRQWTTIGATTRIIPGKSKCTYCGRPARPSPANGDAEEAVLCERCSFECFRCHAVNPVAPATTTLICDSCGGVWEIGALGYECVEQPARIGVKLNVPSLRRFGRDVLEGRLDEQDTTYANDEMNALTDYYFSLAIDRPESPPL